MKNRKKKLLSAMLALTMAVSVFAAAPMTASAAGEVCEIAETGIQYADLDLALAAVDDDETIILIDDVTLVGLTLIIANGKSFTLDTNNYTLDFNYCLLSIENGSKVIFDGCDEFDKLLAIDINPSDTPDTYKAVFNGDLVLENGSLCIQGASEVTVNGNLTTLNDAGIQADGDSVITINGKIEASSGGIVASNGAAITVIGGVDAGYDGVTAENAGTSVTVTGGIVSYDDSIYASDGAVVTVYGDIDSSSSGYGIRASDAGTVAEVFGNIRSYYNGVYAENGAEVTVNGNVVSTGSTGIYALDSGTVIIIIGDVEAADDGISAYNDSSVTVNGSVKAGPVGVYSSDTAIVEVSGNVTALDDRGVYTAWGGIVRIGGNLVADTADWGIFIQYSDTTLGYASVTIEGGMTGLTFIEFYDDDLGVTSIIYNDITEGTLNGDYYEFIYGAANNIIRLRDPDSLVTPVFSGGQAAMALTVGYLATSTPAFTVAGVPAPTVVKTSGDAAITWNDATMKLDVAAGLAAGTYTVTLTADNLAGSATFTFTLTVSLPAPPITPGGGGGPTNYTVTFESNGGSEVASLKIESGKLLAKPEDPTREGFSFKGWFTDEKLETAYDFSKAVTGNFKLYAKWAEKEDLEGEEEEEDGEDVATTPTPITPTMPINPFTDVLGTDWFIDYVIYAHSIGLIDGRTPTTYAPQENMTYAEAVKLAACMHQYYTDGEVTLENGEPWYQSYVDYAKENGIISGDYEWSAPATRRGYIEIFANALPDEAFEGINDIPDGSIPDVAITDPGAAAIYKLYRAGILNGVDVEHNCNPGANIKRSEVAAVLTRMMNPEVRTQFSI